MGRIFCVLELDQHYVESFKVFNDLDKAKKHFKKYLIDSGLNIFERRKAVKDEFYRDGDNQIQLLKKEVE